MQAANTENLNRAREHIQMFQRHLADLALPGVRDMVDTWRPARPTDVVCGEITWPRTAALDMRCIAYILT